MSDESDSRSLLEAAHEAAGAGDYESAERLLREAVARQEASLGPLHPDVAHTLNNLAVVCERLERLAEAEDGYRRAHAIAVASLRPGHPFIRTSLKNLVDFCAARDIPLWTPPAARPAAEAPAMDADVGVSPGDATVPAMRGAQAAGRVVSPRAAAVAALVVVSVAALFLFTAPWRGAGDSSDAGAVPPAPVASPAATTARAEPASPPEAEPPPQALPEPSPEPAAPALPERSPEPAAQATGGDDASRPRTAASPAPITVITAQVCTAFEREGSPDWQCTPAAGVNPPGTFTFYTRLRTDADTTVEHRWYRDDRLQQTMRLRVGANPGNGFRTFSRSTVGADRGGSWRVELRAADGTLLADARFVVR